MYVFQTQGYQLCRNWRLTRWTCKGSCVMMLYLKEKWFQSREQEGKFSLIDKLTTYDDLTIYKAKSRKFLGGRKVTSYSRLLNQHVYKLTMCLIKQQSKVYIIPPRFLYIWLFISRPTHQWLNMVTLLTLASMWILTKH